MSMEKTTDHRVRRRVPALLLVAAATLALGGCFGDGLQTTIDPKSDSTRIIQNVYALVTWIDVGIFIVVFVPLIYALFRFREKKGQGIPKQVHGNVLLEIAWTLIPAVLLIFIAVPTWVGIFRAYSAPAEDALEVEAIGHQWWWEFRYPEQGIVTASQMVVPVGRPLEIRLRSADVIHSFWIPRLGGKRDVNPIPRVPEGETPRHQNRISITIEEPGEYMGQCAEYCGTSHAIMRMLAVAVEPAAFDAWVDAMAAGAPSPDSAAAEADALVVEGRDVFMRSSCIACHAIAGTNARGVIGPNLTAFGDRWSVGSGRLDNTSANLADWIAHAPELKKGVIMPGTDVGAGGMPPTNLTDEQIRAVAAYLSSLSAGLPAGTDGGAPGAE